MIRGCATPQARVALAAGWIERQNYYEHGHFVLDMSSPAHYYERSHINGPAASATLTCASPHRPKRPPERRSSTPRASSSPKMGTTPPPRVTSPAPPTS